MTLTSLRAWALGGVAMSLVAMGAPVAAGAQTVFTQRALVVDGDANLDATSINDHGAIVATLYNAGDVAIGGVVLSGGSVTYLPPPYAGGGPAQPQVIDNAGDVLGYAQNTGVNVPDMFLMRGGVVDPGYDIALIEPFGTEGLTQPNPIGLAHRGIIFYTEIISRSTPTDPSYGIPPHLARVPQFNQFQTIKSVNAAGMVAGVAYALGGPSAVFAGGGSSIGLLTPPGAVSVAGGFINDSDAVAGSYTDTAGAPHGFVYAGGRYASFDMPVAARSVSVTGFSDSGRVVGSFADSIGVQHVFRYNGQAVAMFARFPADVTVGVALNAGDGMVVAVQSGLLFRSYAVTCSGGGC